MNPACGLCPWGLEDSVGLLKLQALVSVRTWELGTELRSSGRAAYALKQQAVFSLQHHVYLFFNHLFVWCVCVCVCLNLWAPCVCSALRGQQRASGIEPQSSASNSYLPSHLFCHYYACSACARAPKGPSQFRVLRETPCLTIKLIGLGGKRLYLLSHLWPRVLIILIYETGLLLFQFLILETLKATMQLKL